MHGSYHDREQKDYSDRHTWAAEEREHTFDDDEDKRLFSVDHYNEASEGHEEDLSGHRAEEEAHHETISSPLFLSTATNVYLDTTVTKFLQNDISVTKFLETANDITVTKF